MKIENATALIFIFGLLLFGYTGGNVIKKYSNPPTPERLKVESAATAFEVGKNLYFQDSSGADVDLSDVPIGQTISSG